MLPSIWWHVFTTLGPRYTAVENAHQREGRGWAYTIRDDIFTCWQRLTKSHVVTFMVIHISQAFWNHEMGFFVQVCSNWQDFNWHNVSRGSSVVAELLVIKGNIWQRYIRRLQDTAVKNPIQATPMPGPYYYWPAYT